jgi:hypothetical protein
MALFKVDSIILLITIIDYRSFRPQKYSLLLNGQLKMGEKMQEFKEKEVKWRIFALS